MLLAALVHYMRACSMYWLCEDDAAVALCKSNDKVWEKKLWFIWEEPQVRPRLLPLQVLFHGNARVQYCSIQSTIHFMLEQQRVSTRSNVYAAQGVSVRVAVSSNIDLAREGY